MLYIAIYNISTITDDGGANEWEEAQFIFDKLCNSILTSYMRVFSGPKFKELINKARAWAFFIYGYRTP